MAPKQELKFPTFECIISNSVEDYDSEVEYFFIHRNHLSAQLAKISLDDREWTDNYRKMIKYLAELADSVVNSTDAPSHQFLVDLSLGEELEEDLVDILLRSKTALVSDLVISANTAREMMYWYVRNGKDQKFSRGFNPERFQGLPFLRLALLYRSIKLSKNQ